MLVLKSKYKRMKKVTLSVVLLFSLFSLHAQDLLGVIFDNNIKANPAIETELEKVVAKTYSTLNFEEGREPDSMLIMNGDTTALFLKSTQIDTYDGKGVHKMYTITPGKEEGFYINRYQDKSGRVTKEEVLYDNTQMAALMNSLKEYTYDEQSRLIGVSDGVTQFMSIEYESESTNLPIALDMNAGFALLSANRVERNDSIIYEMEMLPITTGDEEEGMLAMMTEALADSPKQYMVYENRNGNHHYQMIVVDKETGDANVSEQYLRDAKGLLLEKKVNYTEWKYTYSEQGNLLSSTDLSSEETYTNEYDVTGNLITEFIDRFRLDHSYDDNGRLIKSIKSGYGGDGISEIIIYQNTYRQ